MKNMTSSGWLSETCAFDYIVLDHADAEYLSTGV